MTEPRKRPRAPNGVNLHRFLDEFGVKVRPPRESRTPRPANVVYGGRTIVRLMKQDVERCRTVIMSIKASNPAAFDNRIIWSVFRFIGAHWSEEPRQRVVARFARIDLAEINERAQRLATGRNGQMGKVAEKIATLLADRLLDEDDAA
ncbi:hypothetical protein [Allorhizobium borbori]|uniref:Uncharacterized protein n=1 Tax=Allorhizobium borbori TaxID=485907 RepID=A0A7W6K1P5_9HYPH|nr:hypothetical protein [Allorhizobium borbori]MBB4103559.1 hypothetical protein [Allorhizobium borbori]